MFETTTERERERERERTSREKLIKMVAYLKKKRRNRTWRKREKKTAEENLMQ